MRFSHRNSHELDCTGCDITHGALKIYLSEPRNWRQIDRDYRFLGACGAPKFKGDVKTAANKRAKHSAATRTAGLPGAAHRLQLIDSMALIG